MAWPPHVRPNCVPLSAIEQTEPTRPFEAVGISARIRYWQIARWPLQSHRAFRAFGTTQRKSGAKWHRRGTPHWGQALSSFGGVQPRRRWPLIALPPAPIKGGGGRDLACCWFGGCIERTDHTWNLDHGFGRDRHRSVARTRGCHFARALRGTGRRGFFSQGSRVH